MPKEIPGASTLRQALLAGEPTDDDLRTEDNDEHVDDDSTDNVQDDDADNELQQDGTKDDGDAEDDNEEDVIVKQAIAEGWDPDYDGPDKRSAREFVERGSLFRKISDQKKDISRLSKQVQFLLDRAEQAASAAREQTLAELKAKKREALESHDFDTLDEIDEEIARTRDEIAAETKNKNKQEASTDDAEDEIEFPEEVQDWMKANPWYSEDGDMRDHAYAIGMRYMREHPDDKNPLSVLQYVEKRIKSIYANKFSNERRNKPGVVEGAGTRQTGRQRRKGSGAKHTVADLSPMEQTIMRNMMAQGKIKSEDDYIRSLEKSGYKFNQ